MLIEIIDNNKEELVGCQAIGREESIGECQRCEYFRNIMKGYTMNFVDCQFDAEAAEKERQDELAASRMWNEG